MSHYASSRRTFLASVGSAVLWGALLSKLEAQEEGQKPPKRFCVVQRPVGTVPEHWQTPDTGPNFTLSRILMPFAPHRERMVVLRNLKLPSEGSVGGGHERGTVLLLTGVRTLELYPGNGGDDPKAEAPSLDQIFAREAPDLRGPAVASLQLACDNRADTPEVSTRHLSYAGRHAPMTPYYQPREAYERLFGSLASGATEEAVRQARREKKSVLDFARRDLMRLRGLSPRSQLPSIEAHESAIRELERELDGAITGPAACGIAEEPPLISTSGEVGGYDEDTDARDDVLHAEIARLHFAVVKAAFRCDLTRIVTFQFSPGTNHVSFGGLWPSDPTRLKAHHPSSHTDAAENVEFLARVDTWYAERTSAFLSELAGVTESDGSTLLDNTLVPYVSEVANRHHAFSNMPFVLFGGRGVGLTGNRVWTERSNRMRSTNDLWMACAEQFGMKGFTLGDSDQHTVPLEGLFS